MAAVIKQYFQKFALLILAGMIIVGGFVQAVFMLKGIADKDYLALNKAEEKILKQGTYTVFYEYNENQKHYGPVTITKTNKNTAIDDLLQFTVMPAASGLPEPYVVRDNSLSYTVNEVKGESLYSFRVEKEGAYTVHAQLGDDIQKDGLQAALLYNFKGRLLSIFKIIGTYLLISVPFVLSGLLVYRKQERRSMETKRV